MDKWQSLLERFLRNECAGREKKLVYYALRDGLIDNEFTDAVDTFMNDTDNRMPSVPNEILEKIRSRMQKSDGIAQNSRYEQSSRITQSSLIAKKKAEPALKKRIFPEWLKIAAAVVITLSLSWIIFDRRKPVEQPQVMNTIRVPAGQTVNLTLSDGTNIWLNARTILYYPGAFTGNSREVILDGEGYFDVAQNSGKPFIVHTGAYDVEAIGTQFNVDAYSQETGFNGALFEGSVRITSTIDTSQTIVLSPNTLARLHDGRLVKEDITDFNHYRWREGLICFKDMPFADLIAKFEKCYDIKIILQNKRVTDYAPTGKFRQADGIDYALRVLQRDMRFRYERDEENQNIYIK